MKHITKYIITAFMVIGYFTLNAQIYTWVQPSAFMEDEEITVHFNVCATSLAGSEGPLFLWSAANGGEYAESGECTKNEDVDDEWIFTLTPTDFYGTSIDSITGQLRDADGVATDDFAIKPFDFSVASGVMLTVHPARASYAESVSLIFNAALSDRDDLTGVNPIYMWGWQETIGDIPGQGSWGAYSDKALCEQIEGNIWRKEFIPQVHWETTQAFSEFGCLFANSSGTAQTEDQTVAVFPPYKCEIPSVTFPRKFTQEDVITIICDTKKDENSMLAGQAKVYVQTYTNEGDTSDYYPLPGNNWIIYPPDEVERALMTDVGDGIYHLDIIPYRYFQIDDPDYVISKMTFVFRNYLGNLRTLEVSVQVLPPGD